MWVSFKLLVIRPAKGLDVCQAVLEDDGHGMAYTSNVSNLCLPPTLMDLSSTLVLKYSIWPGEWMEFPLPRKAYPLNMPMTLP